MTKKRTEAGWSKVPQHKSAQAKTVSKKTNNTISASSNKYATLHNPAMNKEDEYQEHTNSIKNQCNNRNININQSKQRQPKINKQHFRRMQWVVEKEERRQHKEQEASLINETMDEVQDKRTVMAKSDIQKVGMVVINKARPKLKSSLLLKSK